MLNNDRYTIAVIRCRKYVAAIKTKMSSKQYPGTIINKKTQPTKNLINHPSLNILKNKSIFIWNRIINPLNSI